ncbi:MAG: shikimate kinase [Cryomorphaceae bacterium]|nr:shikimate kinase [Cryomorphaceae bacterium]
MEKIYPQKIALVGYMGAGKTCMGRSLSLALDLPFYDLDEVIGQLFGCNQVDLMKRKGELAFREAERKALHVVLKKKKFVLACGGGTPAYYDNMDALTKSANVVFLDCQIPTLVARLTPEKNQRPLIESVPDEELETFIGKHLFERRSFYEKAALKVPADMLTVDQLKDALSVSA